ncbi:MAG: phospholipase D-like domain-containing protein [Vicinamibacterales bacterium]
MAESGTPAGKQPHRHRRWPRRVLIGVGIFTGLLLLAQDQETLRVESPVDASDPRFADYVASLVGAAVEPGDAYIVLRNGDAFPPMLSAIQQAKRRITFETYVFKEGGIGDEFVTALAQAAQRGVTVRMILDPIGSVLGSDNQERLKKAGVQLTWFNPLRFWALEETNYRTHRKTLVVDGEVAFTGGMGIADQWLGQAQDPEHWRDTQFQISGPAVRALEASFYENWIESGGRSAPALDPELPSRATGARSVVMWSNPTAGASNVKLLYLLAIGAARTTLDIQSPYITLDESTRWSLAEARRRGVRVRMVTEGEITDAMPVKHASREDYQLLLDQGIQIYEYRPTMMHTKAVMVDGAFSVIGTANFGNRSFELNDELTVAVFDPDLARTLVADFEQDIRASTRLDAETWKDQRSIFGKAQERWWSFFGEIF